MPQYNPNYNLMMNNLFLRRHRLSLQLKGKPFASGGEGDLYHVRVTDLPGNWVAKIYHPPKRTAQRETKINYLLSHRPAALVDGDDKDWMWVKDLIVDASGQFIGLLLPYIQGEKLEVLCSQKLPRSLAATWRRMDLQQEDALDYRIKVGFNLAVAVYRLHSTQHYVLVDMKPDNVLLQSNGLLSIVDLDSMAINEGHRALFPAPVATPEYTPPEYYQQSLVEGAAVDPAWDRFGLAVILYKLFCGIHPFAATAFAPYDGYVSLHQKIEHGLFVHSPSRGQYLQVVPPPHERFHRLPEAVRKLFIQCFEEGHEVPSLRPTAEEWCVALLYAIGEPQLIKRYRGLLGSVWDQPMSKIALPSELEVQYTPNVFNSTQWTREQTEQWVPTVPDLPKPVLQELQVIPAEDKAFTRHFYTIWWLVGLFLLWLILESGLKYAAPIFTYSVSIIGALLWMVVLPRLLAKIKFSSSAKVTAIQVYQQFQTLLKNKDALTQSLEKRLKEHLKQTTQALEGVTELPELPEEWVTYEEQAVRIRSARLEASKQVRKDYLQRALTHPALKHHKVSHLYELWQEVQRTIRQEKVQLNKEKPLAAKYYILEQEHRKRLRTARQTFDEQLKEWGDEARFLFDLDVLFEEEEQGMLAGAEKLREALARKDIHRLIDLEELQWDNHQSLSIQIGGRSFQLNTARYPQLENFFRLYEDAKHSIVFARTHHIDNGKTYIQKRFEVGKETYEAEVAQLEAAHQQEQAQLEAAKQLAVEQSTLSILLEAEEFLIKLRDEQQQALETLEAHYNEQYAPVREKVEDTLTARYEQLNQKRKAYKLSVEELLRDEELLQEQRAIYQQLQTFQDQFQVWKEGKSS